ncbi:MAG TPA: pantetheine-phosphate adenylyltransferase [Acidimicrobiia bacterium]|nr:pantetheine-phosphate adenylyltransferase [Acidimicrobiia bacterium]
MTSALCPGSYDPPTNGHIDVIRRTAAIFDRVVVSVVENPSKTPLFTTEERIELFRASLPDVGNVSYDVFDGLLVDHVRARGIDVVVKGLRTSGDFDYELQMAQMNVSIRGVETVFIPTTPAWSFLSSSLVREVARLGGSVDELVPAPVAAALKEKLS